MEEVVIKGLVSAESFKDPVSLSIKQGLLLSAPTSF